jgi:hypothetical protein
LRRELQTHVARRETAAAGGGTHGDVHDVQHGERDAARIGDGREREPEHAHEVKRECHPQDRLDGQAIGQPAPDVEKTALATWLVTQSVVTVLSENCICCSRNTARNGAATLGDGISVQLLFESPLVDDDTGEQRADARERGGPEQTLGGEGTEAFARQQLVRNVSIRT